MSDQTAPTLYCYFCNKNIPVIGKFTITRTEDCPYCTKALHCCRMCKFFDSKVYNECREPNAERVVDKEKSNFCDYFSLRSGKTDDVSVDTLKSAADLLFKK